MITGEGATNGVKERRSSKCWQAQEVRREMCVGSGARSGKFRWQRPGKRETREGEDAGWHRVSGSRAGASKKSSI